MVLVEFVVKLIPLETFVFTTFPILSRESFPRVLNVALPVLDPAKGSRSLGLALVGFAAKLTLLGTSVLQGPSYFSVNGSRPLSVPNAMLGPLGDSIAPQQGNKESKPPASRWISPTWRLISQIRPELPM